VLSGRGRIGPPTQFETDRARFVGRGGTLARPAALIDKSPLSNTTGAVLDPIVSLRQSIRLPPGGTARLAFTTGFADSEAAARRLVEKYHDRRAVARALALASTHSQIELVHLGLTLDDAIRFQRFAGRLLYADPRLRDVAGVRDNRLGQPDLWKYGISGDLPIVLALVADSEQIPLFRDLLKAHEYLRAKGLAFDLVVLNELGTSYRQDLQDALQQILDSGPEQAWVDRPGGVFLRRADLMTPDDRILLRATARAVMDGAIGDLQSQLGRPQVPFEPLPSSRIVREVRPVESSVSANPRPVATAGAGEFSADGREYIIRVHTNSGVVPPAPWANVVGHQTFGFVATELGPGFTWSENSRNNRLTPWRNDPVRDPQAEALFVRDDDSGLAWSVTPLPAGGGEEYVARHGQGYTSWDHRRHDIQSSLGVFVPPEDRVKIFRLALRNHSSARRHLSITLYAEWVLGDDRARTAPHIVTSRDPATGAVMAANAFRETFGSRVAFVDLHPGTHRTVTGDRTEFLGRNGSLSAPAALGRDMLSNRVGPILDACGAIQVRLTLEPSQEQTVVGLLGEAVDVDDLRRIVARWREPGAVDRGLEQVRQAWDRLLGTVQVRTPDRSTDLMLNRWLLYQTLVCRVWGRSGFYQSGGAFGFRDQLQDVLALLHASPQIAREHLLRAASRQFLEGDVQHWWHEPEGRGVRTRFSDDRLWLVYATLHYVASTNDGSVLEEVVPFLEGRPLNPGEQEAYEQPSVSRVSASLYEHCVRAVEISLANGTHGLPLMGSGDWNDGMNLVGSEGRGESVWLGWFLHTILGPFADVAAGRGELDRADRYRRHASALATSLDNAWDGHWYRRAYFDDGTPLGSASNEECQIDALAQSWSVISGAGVPDRAREAMESVDQRLVKRFDRLLLLLAPPFNRMTPNPGYIQGYLPGVRENGGQYTHAALWTVLAFAELGDGDRAFDLFAMLNPARHALTPDDVRRYRVEPYVVAADVYSQPPHTGRGGWTWYTGAAGWMYRVGLEAILGLSLRGGSLRIDPCIPRSWRQYEIVYRLPGAEYLITVENPGGVSRGVKRIEVDGVEHPGNEIAVAGDGGHHQVRVTLG
jgi:cyclic beta-1,2-glucan synthetase